jgi:hypothetical protein
MFYIVNLMNHLKAIQRCMDDMRGSAIVNAKDLVTLVRVRGRSVHMQPQFTYMSDGRIRYTTEFEPKVSGFIGWRPYFTKRWELSTEKLKFKTYAYTCGIRTPPHSATEDGAPREFLIKKNRSSFGIGMRGPFRQIDRRKSDHLLQEGEYYEAFVPGRIAKAWYWDGELSALELRPPPMLKGNGRHSIAQLAQAQCTRDVDMTALAWIAAYQGRSIDSVLQQGDQMPIDFKYGSPYDAPSRENENVLQSYSGSTLIEQFITAGCALAQGIPESIRRHTLFTLDAVVDDADQVWFLEMNSNPMVHPDVYPVMLRGIFGIVFEEPCEVFAQV